MNDEELKKKVKRSVIIFAIGLIIIVIGVIYIMASPTSKKNIYEEYNSNTELTAGVSKVFLETKGINKEELEKYLSVAAILRRTEVPTDVLDAEKDNYKYMLVTANFIKDVLGEELTLNETDNISYVEDTKINNILKELFGKYIQDNLNVTNYFEYNAEEAKYVVKNTEDYFSYLVELSEVEVNDSLIEIKFKNVFGNNEEITKFINNENVSLETYEFKATLMENEEYEYSKYYINNIELINKETVEYNK